jgi:hypothetical protein
MLNKSSTLSHKASPFIKFVIIVPEKNSLWKINHAKRVSPELVYRFLERKITKSLAVDNDAKIVVEVKYTNHTTNETLKSSDASYLLYTTACFLEDYLSKNSLDRLYKKYNQS